jgi:outer membrane protein assembly factor BamA
LRLTIMKAPLSLDFGFPLRANQFNNHGMQFNFSLGTRF